MSDQPPGEAGDSPTLARSSTVDSVVAVVLFVFGCVEVFEAYRLGSGWGTDGPGAGYFPFYIGVLLCIASLGIFYQSRLGKSRDASAFVDRERFKRVLSVLLPAIAYVFVVEFLGLYVASAIYIALFMIVLGKYPPLKSVLVAVIVIAAVFLMFEVWFKVPLYKGSLSPLSFLGY